MLYITVYNGWTRNSKLNWDHERFGFPSEKMTSYESPGKTKDLVAIVIHEIIRFCNSK